MAYNRGYKLNRSNPTQQPIIISKDEKIMWKEKQKILGSSTFLSITLVGVFLILAGLFLLSKAEILVIIGMMMVGLSILTIKNRSTYYITNKRIIEVKKNKIIKEVSLSEIIQPTTTPIAKTIGKLIDLTYILTGHPIPIPSLLGIGTIKIRNTKGEEVFTFKKVKVKKVKEKLLEALKQYSSRVS